MAALASLRVSTKCPRCEMPLVIPERSEYVSEQETVHSWQCPVCGKEFKTVDTTAAPTVPNETAAGDCFTCLLVA
jgi:transposase-like protein